MSEVVAKQIGRWSDTIKDYIKAIKRKNKYINRLERDNLRLQEENRRLQTHLDIARTMAESCKELDNE